MADPRAACRRSVTEFGAPGVPRRSGTSRRVDIAYEGDAELTYDPWVRTVGLPTIHRARKETL